MKTAKDRDAMVKLANATLEKYPTFMLLPEVKADPKAPHAKVENDAHDTYVRAVYEVCREAKPIGRAGQFIIGA